ALFAPEGIFLGTDATERWTVDEFRAYARPIFSKGKGWTYHPGDRHIDIAKNESFAFFDELLDNEKYGTCRGTGLLRIVDGEWRIVQYHLTIPVPNDLAERVARMIKNESGRKK
ncbi:MAG: nuclear transport factor 2 family protein, partial [Phycisphaerales bacterium]